MNLLELNNFSKSVKDLINQKFKANILEGHLEYANQNFAFKITKIVNDLALDKTWKEAVLSKDGIVGMIKVVS
jgi:hypothetical protein